MQIGNPQFGWLALSAIIAVILLVRNEWLRRRALNKFVSASQRSAQGSMQPGLARLASATLLAAGLVLLAVALMDIRWGKTQREVPQKGLEVVFALDVSRSMLAKDVNPNRLARAKQQIKDMVDEMAGDRIGLVVFAGEADQAVPLTNHYEDFKQILDSVGPHSVSRGGSQLGVAITSASKAFINKTNDHKTIVLFTDGEDQESQPIELARELHSKDRTRIFTVGLGDMDQGARIPSDSSQRKQFVEHEGQQVWSKLNGSILREIATETNAAYIPAGTKRVNMADVYHGYLAQVEQTEFETARINAYIPRFQWFAVPAFFCLFLHCWLATLKRKMIKVADRYESEHPVTERSSTQRRTKVPVAAAILLLVAVPQSSLAEESNSIASQINAANELVRQQKVAEAIEAYGQIESSSPNHRAELSYNLAVAHYRNSDYAAAAALFRETAKSSEDSIAAGSRYNLGNCHYAQALPLVNQQPEAAIAELEQAIQHYRSALRLDRTNADARKNIELARKLIAELNEKLMQEQQQKNQQQDRSDQQSQDNQQQSESKDRDQPEQQEEQNSDQQKKDQNKSADQQQGSKSENDRQSQQEQNQKDEGSPNEQQPEQPQQSTQNQSSSDGQQSTSESENQSADQPGEDSPESDRDRKSTKSRQTESDQRTDDESEQLSPDSLEPENKEPEKTPQGKLSTANQQSDDNRKPKEQAIANISPGDPDKLMTREEALKLLQAVRDRDMLRRLRQQQRQRSRKVKVERDW